MLLSLSVANSRGTEETATRAVRKQWLLVTIISLAYVVGLVYYAATRPIDGDEGFYTTAARLVWEGKTPYRDFFFQQAPLLPYLYSWIWAIHPRSLVAMRLLSVAAGGLAVFLWGAGLVSVKRLPVKVALATFLAVALNPYWVCWNVVVKTFAFANLFMTAAAICLYAALRSERPRWYFAGGLALGLCTSARALYGPLIPAVLIWLLIREWRRSKSYSMALAFLIGTACGLLPMMVSFLGDPHAFLFNNVQYHGLQAGFRHARGSDIYTVGYHGLGDTLAVYFYILVMNLLGLHPYFTIQVVLTILGGLSLRKLSRNQDPTYAAYDYAFVKLATLMLAVYTVTALIPFPPYLQYFDGPLVPFMLPFIAEGLRVAFRAGKQWVVLLAVLAPILCLSEVRAETATTSSDAWWRLASYRQVTQVIEANSRPDDVVLSFWPGYVFESGRRYFPGMEDQFVYRITNMIGPEARARYHVVSTEAVTTAISTRAVPLLVVGAWMPEYYRNLTSAERQAFDAAVDANYSPVSQADGVAVYRRRE